VIFGVKELEKRLGWEIKGFYGERIELKKEEFHV